MRRLTPLECISIHASREGGDAYCGQAVSLDRISIHASREGGDCIPWHQRSLWQYFNPRLP